LWFFLKSVSLWDCRSSNESTEALGTLWLVDMREERSETREGEKYIKC
jgi:hypothetical protein